MSFIAFPFLGGSVSKILVTSQWSARHYGHPVWHLLASLLVAAETPIYGIDGLLLSMLGADIKGEPYSFELHSFESVRSAAKGRTILIQQLSASLVEQLSELPSADVAAVATRWSRHEEFPEHERATPELVASLTKAIQKLSELARVCRTKQRSMYWWAAVA